jgi:hypothetical protein
VKCGDVKAKIEHPPHWHVVSAEGIVWAQGECSGYPTPTDLGTAPGRDEESS